MIFWHSFSDPLWFIIAGLATWRIASIVQREKVFAWFRKLLGIKVLGMDEDGFEITSYPDNVIGDLFSCFWCVSVWAAVAVGVIWYFLPIVLLPFALSTIAIVIKGLEHGG